jgi:hypothetical protein
LSTVPLLVPLDDASRLPASSNPLENPTELGEPPHAAEETDDQDGASHKTNESDPDGLASHTAISALYSECILKLNTLLAAMNEMPLAAEMQDLSWRLQIWAGNHGAHRKQIDHLSLDHRLREASELHKEVRYHFNDLIQATEDGEYLAAVPFQKDYCRALNTY